jgi:hypothetical protein
MARLCGHTTESTISASKRKHQPYYCYVSVDRNLVLWCKVFANLTTVQISNKFPTSCTALSCARYIYYDPQACQCPNRRVPCYFVLLLQTIRHLVFWPSSHLRVISFLEVFFSTACYEHNTTTVLNHNNHILFPHATNDSTMPVSFLSCPRAPKLFGTGSQHPPPRLSVIAVVLRARLR